MKTKVLPYAALALFVAEMLLCLVSWIVSVLLPESGVRSAFSGEGIRWLMGHYAEFLASPLLAWLLLLSMAYGTCRGHPLPRAHSRRHGPVHGRGLSGCRRFAVVDTPCRAPERHRAALPFSVRFGPGSVGLLRHNTCLGGLRRGVGGVCIGVWSLQVVGFGYKQSLRAVPVLFVVNPIVLYTVFCLPAKHQLLGIVDVSVLP